jgi:F-box-like
MNWFQVLPEEISSQIFSYCTGEELLALTETCKDFKNIIGLNKNLMRKIRLKLFFGQESENHEHRNGLPTLASRWL